ncbi:MAG: glycoside hydrolase family 11 protein, partial [Oscillospiraceae bacterium]|nr:glycoside hydrolase family 11 protein [Oscillospiraceae bacterium]
MKRKFLALIIAMAVVMSLVPMVPITAAVKGTATITGNKVEFADFGPIEGVARLGFFVRIEAVDGSIAGSVNVTLPGSTPNITRTIANNNSANLQLNAGTHQNLSVDLGGEFTLGEFLSIEFTSGNLYLRGVEFYDKDNNLIKAKLTGNYIKRLGDWDVEAYRLTNDRMLMDYYGDGTFSANWTLTSGGFGNVLARTGRKFGGATQVRNSGKPHTEHGEIYINYEATQEYNNTRSLIGVYGWTISPAPTPLALIEYYIFDSWDAYKKGPASGGASFKGEYTIPEEGTYVLYENIMNNAPDVMGGNSTFPQLFSIRKDDKRVKGKISVTEHFNAWEKLGYDLGGNLYEVSMLVETMTGNGRTSSASIDKLALSIGGAYVGGTEPGNGGEDPPKEPTALN